MAKQLFLYLNERKGLPEWVAGKGRVKDGENLSNISMNRIASYKNEKKSDEPIKDWKQSVPNYYLTVNKQLIHTKETST